MNSEHRREMLEKLLVYGPNQTWARNVSAAVSSTLVNNTLAGTLSAANDTNSWMHPVLFQARYNTVHIVVTSVILAVIILCTIIGNVFVVAAIILEKNLQSVSNYLILSLAVADLMVATLVMPISALNELSKAWWLGIHLCDLWICFDILCCTASILHLVGIAVDRYWAVTNVDYIRVRTGKRIGLMIVAVWVISLAISLPARFTLTDELRRTQIANGTCAINEDTVYTIFSTVGAFYLPMLFMIAIYIKIYQTARKRIRKKAFKGQNKAIQLVQNQQRQESNLGTPRADDSPEAEQGLQQQQQTTSFIKSSGKAKLQKLKKFKQQQQHNGDRHGDSHPEERRLTPQSKAAHQREKLEHKRERKAARTLAIITGCFLICWIPFFLRATICPFCADLCFELIPDSGHSFILWLGYMNSLLNPVIYTIFSPDFRNAFSKILFGRYHRRGYR